MSPLMLCLLASLQIPIEVEQLEPAHVQAIAPVQTNADLNVVSSTWVITDLNIGKEGRVHFPRALKGGDPLRRNVLWSVSGWTFSPARTLADDGAELDSHVLAIFLFRGRDIFSASAPNLSGVEAAGPDRPPIPLSLSDPGYMPNSVAEGAVVVELRLLQSGAIDTVRVVKGIPGLSEFTEHAVRSWKFAPALSSGQPVPGTVVVSISYLRPT